MGWRRRKKEAEEYCGVDVQGQTQPVVVVVVEADCVDCDDSVVAVGTVVVVGSGGEVAAERCARVAPLGNDALRFRSIVSSCVLELVVAFAAAGTVCTVVDTRVAARTVAAVEIHSNYRRGSRIESAVALGGQCHLEFEIQLVRPARPPHPSLLLLLRPVEETRRWYSTILPRLAVFAYA